MSAHPGLSPAGEARTFEEYLLRVNPTHASLQNLAEQPDETPMMMLNLLRFRPRGDHYIYSLYGKEVAQEIKKVGGFVAYYGKVLTDIDQTLAFDDSWDAVAVPLYHRRRSFLELQKSQRYQLAIPYRVAGTSRRTLYVLSDGKNIYENTTKISQLDVTPRPLNVQDGEVYVVDLLRFNRNGGREDFKAYAQSVLPLLQKVGAVPILSVNPELPILSEELWNHCTFTRFPSIEMLVALYRSTAWKSAQTARTNSLENSMRLATQSIALPR